MVESKSGVVYSFMHKSILEYFAVLQGVEDVRRILKSPTQDVKSNVFNEKVVIDKGMLQFYVEFTK